MAENILSKDEIKTMEMLGFFSIPWDLKIGPYVRQKL